MSSDQTLAEKIVPKVKAEEPEEEEEEEDLVDPAEQIKEDCAASNCTSIK